MGKISSLVLAALLAMIVASQSGAQQKDAGTKQKEGGAAEKDAGKPAIVVAQVASMKAAVEAVDQQNRTVTLKGPKGNSVTLKVSKDVKNFDQVKVGDQLAVKFYDSVAVFVRKSSEPPVAEEAAAVQLAAKGAKPGAVVVSTKEVTATVEAIDYKTRTVTLKGPQGNSVTLKVDKNVKRLDNVKKGDEVVVRQTEALAIAVEKPK